MRTDPPAGSDPDGALVIQRPAAPRRLVLLLHGVGASPADLRPLGTALAVRYEHDCIACLRAPFQSDLGYGWQWFSVRGVDEANRPDRVAAAMPSFRDIVQHWQRETGVGAAGTTLIGFSQGAIMSLESTQSGTALASRVIAIGGRFAQAPQVAPEGVRFHVMHGEADRIMPTRLSIEAVERLQALRADATLDVFPALGHGIDERVLDRVAERMADGA